MEDWEEFFLEKSRRRFEKERLERRRQRLGGWVTAVILGLIIIGGLIGLAVLR